MTDSKYSINKKQKEALELISRDKTQDKEIFSNKKIATSMFIKPCTPLDVIEENDPAGYKRINRSYKEDTYKFTSKRSSDKIDKFIKKLDDAGFIEKVVERRKVKQLRKKTKRAYPLKFRDVVCKYITQKAFLVSAENKLKSSFSTIAINILNSCFFASMNTRKTMVKTFPDKDITELPPHFYLKFWLIPYLYEHYDKKDIVEIKEKTIKALVEPEKFDKRKRRRVLLRDQNYVLAYNDAYIVRGFGGPELAPNEEKRLVDFNPNYFISFYIALRKYYKKEVDALDKKMLKLLGLI